MGLGCVEGVTHAYARHGTITLFAALDIVTGAVFTDAGRDTVIRSAWPFSGALCRRAKRTDYFLGSTGPRLALN